MEKIKNRKVITIYWCLLAASAIFGLIITFNPGIFSGCISYLTGKANQVLGLTMLSSGVATGISLVPGEAGMPLADMLVNFSGVLLVILIGIMLEKYLLVLTGSAAFLIMLPAAFLLLIRSEYVEYGKERLRKSAFRRCTAALSLFLVVPVSIGVSRMIDYVYENPVEQTLESETVIEEEMENLSGAEEKDQSLWDKIVNGVSSGVDSMVSGVSGMVDQAKNTVNRLIESIAVMAATCLLIPILVYLILYWGLRQIFGSRLPDLESIGSAAGRTAKRAKAMLPSERGNKKAVMNGQESIRKLPESDSHSAE